MRVLIGQINPIIGDFSGNCEKILQSIKIAKGEPVDVVLFPELAICGYPPQDLLLHPSFINDVQGILERVITASKGMSVVVGLPRCGEGEKLYNSAAVIEDGVLLGFQDKVLLPTYDVFDERRYFEPGGMVRTWPLCGQEVGVTICEDIWFHSGAVEQYRYSRDPILELRQHKPDVVFNLSASPYSVAKPHRRFKVCQAAAMSLKCPVVMCNQVGGNDSLIFDGYSVHVDAEGEIVRWAKAFDEENKIINTEECGIIEPFEDDLIGGLYGALVLGVRDYFRKQGFHQACLGLSGGIDSAVVACIAVEALGKEHVLGLTMPSRYSSESSVVDAQQLADNLGIALHNISIEGPFSCYLELLKPHFEGRKPDVTEENLQARTRGMILMAMSNKLGCIVLSTGNKSETAMGYSTLYGDMCGGMSVINDVSKGQVYALAHWINKEREVIPWDTIEKPPSAELRPDQRDSDSLPPYDVIDNVLKEYVEEYKTQEAIAEKKGY